MDTMIPIVQPLAVTLSIILLVTAWAQRRKHWLRAVWRLVAAALALLAAVGILEMRWRQKHDAFHELAWRLAPRRGRCPERLSLDVATAPVAERVALRVDTRMERIVWQGFSLRRAETYDCATGEFRLR